jgi:hypothetical protein
MKKMLSPTVLLVSCTILLSACDKEVTDNDSDDVETTIYMSKDKAISDNVTEDLHNLMIEVAAEEGLLGSRPSNGSLLLQDARILTCANVSVSPINSFPKTIVVDFGSGCTDLNGITRRGIVTFVISDSLRKAGCFVEMTLQDYHVQNFKKEGLVMWTNISSPTTKIWQREVVGGKITDTLVGRYWQYQSNRTIEQSAGSGTPFVLADDEYLTTGTGSVSNIYGDIRYDTITTTLHRAMICPNIDKGTVSISGGQLNAILDFGDGTCDQTATITVTGYPPRTIYLR